MPSEKDQGAHLGLLDDADHEAKLDADEAPTRARVEYRNAELRIQALGAALSRRDWHATERAYEAIRDAFYTRRQ
jgi:hypothetical protein